MSREDLVFTKKAIVAVSVISVIASNVLIGAMAILWLWGFADKIEAKTTEAATKAAVAAAEKSIQPLNTEFQVHKATSDRDIESLKSKQAALESRINRPTVQ